MGDLSGPVTNRIPLGPPFSKGEVGVVPWLSRQAMLFLESVAAPAVESRGRWSPPFLLSVAAPAAESGGRRSPPFLLSVAAPAAESKDATPQAASTPCRSSRRSGQMRFSWTSGSLSLAR